MPLYVYEPVDRECLMCPNRIEVLQGVNDPPLEYCPYCGLRIRRVIAPASFHVSSGLTAQKAADRGFTTWKRTGKGVWEKVAGPGVDYIVGDPSTVEQKPVKKIDLDRQG